ncbi:uncharacterized protein N7443_004152 [Penicillium atrosanguineum]|uniref:Uncharacterized protein n=1 Tax=Penicillium atrosanguineum TaxID=1132637 RepID=A0A9W9Q5E3_9EURO|nr:uncharacterized protein N7443_004152 [Penicillium atrosanguineum]KAJ5134219.1 hypothetical protein N7526_005584 [Penicillium atrosanguineum]KAJ5304492.1 hypothetical protein N7443_004152 [Penicillium atrosanguineum]KAJ5323963.1 hypothetical protein N7476_002563 [Penicillium atrosanguineum]
MYFPRTKNEWWFSGTITLQAALIVILEVFGSFDLLTLNSYILTQWQSWTLPHATQVQISYIVPVSLALLIFACIYAAILSLDGIHCKNNILLFALCGCNVLILIFSAMQYGQLRDAVNNLPLQRDSHLNPLVKLDMNIWSYIQPAQLAAIIFIGLCSPITWVAAYYLHKEYAWALYRQLHGDSSFKIRYLAYEIFLVLIKLDFFFLVGFIVQYDLVDVHFEEPEYSLTLALIPVSFIIMLMGIWTVRSEWKIATFSVIVCLILLMAYLLSRIIILCGHTSRANTAGKDTMLLLAITSLVLTFFTVICVIQCFFNFGHGLESIIGNKKQPSRDYGYDSQTISSSMDGHSLEFSKPNARLSIE